MGSLRQNRLVRALGLFLAVEGFGSILLLSVMAVFLVPIDILEYHYTASAIPYAIGAMIGAGVLVAYLARSALEYPKGVLQWVLNRSPVTV